uniref:Tryptophan synthase alpha chain n=1 Tax=candidate division WOR-3 bacterium TaxID=2052148 RepID=A0A7V3RH11_UNCW3
MNKIEEKFEYLSKNKESALIIYLIAGYPKIEESIKYIKESSPYADIIEIGIPFSDPIADGKTIQYASNIALNNRVSLYKILEEIAQIKIDTPLVIMTYLNPILAFGIEEFFSKISQIGISGVIVPDLVVEESNLIKKFADEYKIDLIQLIAPTSNTDRIKLIGRMSSGFIYCVSVTGTTGVRKNLPKALPLFVKKVKRIVKKPVVVGFGISTPAQIKKLCQVADGVVIGSRIIEAIKNKEDLKLLLKEFKEATIKNKRR